jgi:hypothetical protein
MAGNVGAILYLSKQMKMIFESAFRLSSERRMGRGIAEESASQTTKKVPGKLISGRRIFMTAPPISWRNSSPSRFLPTWELLYDCWLKALPFRAAD